MYEKPQYLTGEGFRRSGTNPSKKAVLKKKLAAAKAKEQAHAALRATKASMPRAGRPISKEAAKLIAMAIRDMLHQK
jgi:hypothetical protein